VRALKGANLALRFALELCLLASVAYWGSQVGSSVAVNVIVAIAAQIALATIWGVYLAPKASRRLELPMRWLPELAVLGLAVAALAAAGSIVLAAILAAAAILNGAVLHFWGLDTEPAV
jgi:N6-adenosine-specific RNA methylase IME4